MFTRQHFEAVAEIIRSNSNVVGSNVSYDTGALVAGADIAMGLADLFAKDNSAFDTEKFYLACGLDK